MNRMFESFGGSQEMLLLGISSAIAITFITIIVVDAIRQRKRRPGAHVKLK